MNAVRISIPLLEALTNRANGSHGHWAPRAREKRDLRELVFMTASTNRTLRAAYVRWITFAKRTIPVLRADTWLAGELTVVVTRVSPRGVDGHDGLTYIFKPAVDAIADALGLRSDRDRRVSWRYAQAEGEPRIDIEIAPRRTCPTCRQVVIEQQEQQPTTKKRAARAAARSEQR